jgi:hypothetical protein
MMTDRADNAIVQLRRMSAAWCVVTVMRSMTPCEGQGILPQGVAAGVKRFTAIANRSP